MTTGQSPKGPRTDRVPTGTVTIGSGVVEEILRNHEVEGAQGRAPQAMVPPGGTEVISQKDIMAMIRESRAAHTAVTETVGENVELAGVSPVNANAYPEAASLDFIVYDILDGEEKLTLVDSIQAMEGVTPYVTFKASDGHYYIGNSLEKLADGFVRIGCRLPGHSEMAYDTVPADAIHSMALKESFAPANLSFLPANVSSSPAQTLEGMNAQQKKAAILQAGIAGDVWLKVRDKDGKEWVGMLYMESTEFRIRIPFGIQQTHEAPLDWEGVLALAAVPKS